MCATDPQLDLTYYPIGWQSGAANSPMPIVDLDWIHLCYVKRKRSFLNVSGSPLYGTRVPPLPLTSSPPPFVLLWRLPLPPPCPPSSATSCYFCRGRGMEGERGKGGKERERERDWISRPGEKERERRAKIVAGRLTPLCEEKRGGREGGQKRKGRRGYAGGGKRPGQKAQKGLE